jgi:peptidoglycan/LPS O-acetylase OafA/YrhL
MPDVTRRRTVAVALALLLLLVVAWGTLWGGLRQAPRATTLAQRAETGIQIACGLLSLLLAFTHFRWRRRARVIGAAWGASLAATAFTSAIAWGPPMPAVGALFAGGALLLAWGTLRALGQGRPRERR